MFMENGLQNFQDWKSKISLLFSGAGNVGNVSRRSQTGLSSWNRHLDKLFPSSPPSAALVSSPSSLPAVLPPSIPTMASCITVQPCFSSPWPSLDICGPRPIFCVPWRVAHGPYTAARNPYCGPQSVACNPYCVARPAVCGPEPVICGLLVSVLVSAREKYGPLRAALPHASRWKMHQGLHLWAMGRGPQILCRGPHVANSRRSASCFIILRLQWFQLSIIAWTIAEFCHSIDPIRCSFLSILTRSAKISTWTFGRYWFTENS